MSGINWTPEIDARLTALWGGALPLPSIVCEISDALGRDVCESTVVRRARRLGLGERTLRPDRAVVWTAELEAELERRWRDGEATDSIAADLARRHGASITASTVRSKARRLGLPPRAHAHAWTAERTAEMRRLWAEGVAAAEIARRLGGVTRNGVIGKLGRLGLIGSGRQTTAPRLQTQKPPTPRPQTQKPPTLKASRARAKAASEAASVAAQAAAEARRIRSAPDWTPPGPGVPLNAAGLFVCRTPKALDSSPSLHDMLVCGETVHVAYGSCRECAARLKAPPAAAAKSLRKLERALDRAGSRP